MILGEIPRVIERYPLLWLISGGDHIIAHR